MPEGFVQIPHWVFSGLAGGAISIFLVSIACAVSHKQKIKQIDGWRYIQPGWGFKVLTALCAAIAIFIIYAAYHARSDQKDLAAIVSGTLALGAAFLVYEVGIRRVRWNTEQIESIHPFWTTKIEWKNLARVTPYSVLEMLHLRPLSGRGILVPLYGGAEVLGRYLQLRDRAYWKQSIMIKNISETSLLPGWKPISAIARNAQTNAVTHSELESMKAMIVSLGPKEWWHWHPDIGFETKIVVLSGEATLWFMDHQSSLQRDDTISFVNGVACPWAIENGSDEVSKLLIVGLENTST